MQNGYQKYIFINFLEMKTLPNRYFSIYLVFFVILTLTSCGNKNTIILPWKMQPISKRRSKS